MTAFISDIHGNFPALLAVFEALDALGVSEVYSLGDVAGYYPMINECIDLLTARSVSNILGNHDNYLVNGVISNRSRSVNRAVAYQRSLISEERLSWLKNSPLFFDEPGFFAVHGGMADHLEEYTRTPVFYELAESQVFLCGHTHIQQLAENNNKAFCNPGSVGQPRDGDPKAAYAVLHDNGSMELCRVAYDIDRIAAEAKKAGFEKGFYEGLYTGMPISPKKG